MTLFELVVILAVISIMALASYPMITSTLRVLTSKGAVEQVAGAIREARQTAITRGTRHCIEFASPAVQYQIRETSSSGTTNTCTGTVVQAWVDVANGAAVTNPSPAPTMVFDPIGNVTLPASPPVTFTVDTTPASCASTVLVTIYGGVRSSKC
jgi:type II secretory pathway pseudopilin PulG